MRSHGFHEAFPPEATRKRLSHSPTLYSVWLEANILFEGLEEGVFSSVVYLDLLVIVGMLAEPVVWHFFGDWGRLPLVAAADDLDAPTLDPVEEGFQSVAGHCADVPYYQTGNKVLSYPFGRPVCLAAPAEEAVIGLGLDAPGPHLFRQTVGRGDNEGFSGAEELDRSRGFAAAPAAVKLIKNCNLLKKKKQQQKNNNKKKQKKKNKKKKKKKNKKQKKNKKKKT